EPGPSLQPPQRWVMASAVEAKPIDDGTMTDQAEHARARVSGLRPRRDRADLGKSEADSQQSIRHAGIFVEARRDADRVGKLEIPKLDSKPWIIGLFSTRIEACLQRAQRQLVGVL